jgi:hypothetical protein
MDGEEASTIDVSPDTNNPSVKEGEKIQGQEKRSGPQRLVFPVKDLIKTVVHSHSQ